MKKFLVYLIVIFMFSCDNQQEKKSDLLNFVPPKTAAILKTDNLDAFRENIQENKLVQENASIDLIQFFSKNLFLLNHIQLDQESLLCYTKNGRDQYGFTLITAHRPTIVKTDSITDKKVESFTYDGQEVQKYTLENKVGYGTKLNDKFIFSNSKIVLENIIRVHNNKLPQDPQLTEIYAVAGNNNAALFINHPRLGEIYAELTPKKSSAYLASFSDWSALDIQIEENSLQLNGVSKANTQENRVLNIFKNTKAQTNEIADITPVNASGIYSFTYRKYENLRQNISSFREKDVPELENEALLNSAQEIGVIYANKKAAVILNSIDNSITQDALLASQQLKDEFRGISIYEFSSPNFFHTAFYPLIKQKKLNFYAVIDHFFVFAENQQTIENIIANYQNRSILGNQAYYQATREKLSDESSLLFIGINENIKNLLAESVAEKHQNDFKKLALTGNQLSALQFVYDKDFAHVNLLIEKAEATKKTGGSAQLNSIKLEEELATRPIFVTNWRTNNQNIAVQGISNTLYIYDGSGNLRWKKKLDGRILGDIQEMDIYNNNRIQLVFNTQNSFYLFDIDGDTVKPFPKEFSETITQPLAVFDYDNNSKYRFIVTRGNKLSMYNKEGKEVKGFTFNKTKSDVSQTPKHIRIGKKDYIVIPENNGDLHILNRVGKTRVKVDQKINLSENDWFLYDSKFTSTTKDGKLIQITENGKSSTKNLDLAEAHTIDATAKTLVSFSENLLTIKGKKVELDFGLYTEPKIFYINNKLYISITDTQASKVYLFDSNANLLSGFPVYGNSAISLANLDNRGSLEFCVQGEEDSILIYSLE
ncbi:hypothetical protein [Mesonia aquimarina]|uniref:hypothetical protein n=1 Tax=Mesonia aquimarina TaxID=1504967 RepID=UPI0013CE946F|nr:hypothetical protein [Mesonia aquimarina]